MDSDIAQKGQAAAAEEERGRTGATQPGTRLSATILIVDDDAFVLDMMSELLSCNRYRIITASCGEDAISRLQTARVDVALVDLKMSGMDGLETIEKLAEVDPDTVTILMTGFPTIDSSIRAMRLGASDYILKPFKIDEVNLAVEKAIRQRNLRLEMKNLRERVSELEKGVSERKESIKVNEKLGVVSTLEGYSAKIVAPNDPRTNPSKPD